MAIVSKAVFEKDSPGAKLGAVLPLKVYKSASKHLSRLDKQSRLFLVTVRPPHEALWLVAVLDGLRFDGETWQAARNSHPLTDISGLKDELRFDSGKGLAAAKGALGMSLQTPRVLTPDDAALLLKAAGGAKPARAPGPLNLAVHHESSPLPCLCRKCLPSAAETVAVDGAAYFRAHVIVQGRILWFWVPEELKARVPEVAQAVANRLTASLEPRAAGEAKEPPDDD